MRTGNGGIKVLDFGLARQLGASPSGAQALTSDGTFLGTPAYMSPEQIRGREVDARSDLFSLAVLIYELATGVSPFLGTDPASTVARVLETEPVPFADRVPVDWAGTRELTALADVVNRCLQKDPAKRMSSAARVEAALDGAVDAPATPRQRPTASAVWWWQFHQAAACLAYCLLLVPLWLAGERLGGATGPAVFVVGLVAAVVTITLRLHLWFTVRSYPDQWSSQRAHAFWWIRWGDLGFVAALGSLGLALVTSHRIVGLVLIGAPVLVLLAFLIIEPATERAAFGSGALSRRRPS